VTVLARADALVCQPEASGAGGESEQIRGNRPGGAGNVALNIRHWVRRPGWWASPAMDEAAVSLKQRLNAAGVYWHFQAHAARPPLPNYGS